MKHIWKYCALLSGLIGSLPAHASSVHSVSSDRIEIYALSFDQSESGIGNKTGSVTLREVPEGLLFDVKIKDLSPGKHGFHIHENADCGFDMQNNQRVLGLKAGGHFDPFKTKSHKGPFKNGHLGDLPVLTANHYGAVNTRFIMPKLSLAAIRGRSFIIHAGGDNYSDEPNTLGGGGKRIACGIIQK